MRERIIYSSIALLSLALIAPEDAWARRGGGGRGGFGGGGMRGGAPRVSRGTAGRVSRPVSRPGNARPSRPISRPAPGHGSSIGRGGVPGRINHPGRVRPGERPSPGNIYRHIGATPTRPFPGSRPGGDGIRNRPTVRPPIANRPPLRPTNRPPNYRAGWLRNSSSSVLRGNLSTHWNSYHGRYGYFPYGRTWHRHHGAHVWWWGRPGFNPWVIPGLMAVRNWIGAYWYQPGSYYAPITYYDTGAAISAAYAESAEPVMELAETGEQADVDDTDEWMSLGVYGLIKQDETNYTVTVQLAVAKNGAIRGYQTDLATNAVAEIVGAIDTKTLRAAWRAEGTDSLMFETSVDNFGQEEFLVNVYDPIHRTAKAWQMVRAQQPGTPDVSIARLP